jgi:hypothetical protein
MMIRMVTAQARNIGVIGVLQGELLDIRGEMLMRT